MPKSGRFSEDEKNYIRDNCHVLSPHVIAQKLDRNVKSIKETAQKMGAIFYQDSEPATEEVKSTTQLSNSPEWAQIQNEFERDEIIYFQKKFGVLIQQFGTDIKSTELSQIFQLIKFEILMSRNLQGNQESKAEINRLKDVVKRIYAETDVTDMTKDLQNMIINYENQIASLRGIQEGKSREYSDLNKSHVALMRELKATRDQRINKIEDTKRTWLDVIKQFTEEDYRLGQGRQNELVKLAVQKEGGRLADYHKFQNGELDRPILNSDTVGEDEDE